MGCYSPTGLKPRSEYQLRASALCCYAPCVQRECAYASASLQCTMADRGDSVGAGRHWRNASGAAIDLPSRAEARSRCAGGKGARSNVLGISPIDCARVRCVARSCEPMRARPTLVGRRARQRRRTGGYLVGGSLRGKEEGESSATTVLPRCRRMVRRRFCI